MINGVTNTAHVAQSFSVQAHPQNPQTHKNVQNEQEPQDTVVLSKKATESARARNTDHQGDHR